MVSTQPSSTAEARARGLADSSLVPLLVTAALLAIALGLQLYAQVCCATITPGAIAIPGIPPDSLDYTMGAVGLLHGSYMVDYDGPARVPQYPPGMSLLLAPAIALGGIQSAIWVTYLSVVLAGAFAAILAWRVMRPWWAPVAVILVLFVPATQRLGHMIMSELPSTALALGEVVLLVVVSRGGGAFGAGLVGGALAWLRPASAALLVAGAVSALARRDRTRSVVFYALGAVIPLVLLGLVQWRMFGSPFTTGYQAIAINPTGGHELNAFFSLNWAVGPPFQYDNPGMGGTGVTWHLLNFELYPLQFLGLDLFAAWPLIDLAGLLGAFMLARGPSQAAILGRFTILAVIMTLAAYVPYWFQSGRFLIIPASLLALSATVVLRQVLIGARH